jgi:hypothetical protein
MQKATIGAFLLSAALQAQWLNLPTPGIPRTSDGKPNLSAAVPRTADGKPDLSGIWGMNPGAYGNNIAADLKPDEIQPWTRELYAQRGKLPPALTRRDACFETTLTSNAFRKALGPISIPR